MRKEKDKVKEEEFLGFTRTNKNAQDFLHSDGIFLFFISAPSNLSHNITSDDD